MHTGERSAVAPPLRWAMWIIAAFLFLVGSFHRAAPGVIARDPMHEFAATGATVGLRAATYFYAYAGRMIPEAYRDAFAVCAACVPAAALLSLLRRETRGPNNYAQLHGAAMREPA